MENSTEKAVAYLLDRLIDVEAENKDLKRKASQESESAMFWFNKARELEKQIDKNAMAPKLQVGESSEEPLPWQEAAV